VQLERIIIAVDGSDNGAVALDWGVDLAVRVDAEVVAVHALGLLIRGGDDEPVPAQPHRDEVRRRFEDVWCAPLDRSDLRSRRILRDGNPVSVLLATAADEDADLIVVGSRGRGGFPELLLGSTSTQVAQHATVPVTIVPTGRSGPGAPV
jgi:nucleotide-binding universal stress UspA family protein